MMRLIRSEGRISVHGADIQGFNPQMRPLRGDMQIVFQDPYGSLSPRMTVEEIIAEGLSVMGEPGGTGAKWWPRSWARWASIRSDGPLSA